MINLLPPEYKKELKGEEQFRLVLILGILLVVFLICLSLALLAIRVYIAGDIEAQRILVESEKRGTEELRIEEFRKLNGEVAGLLAFYEQRVLVSDIIAQISDALPQNVYLTSLNVTAAPDAKITLRGFAPRTEDLLELQTNIEENPLFVNLNIPPANWARATNINFSVDFEYES